MDNKIQVLIATMNQEDISFLDKMNIQTNAIVGNQNGRNDFQQFIYNDKVIDLYCSNEKGLSNNRNLVLNNATADICILSDDDVIYVDKYDKIVKNAFDDNPNADVIIFNLYENQIKRYVIKRKFQVNLLNFMRFGSVRIAFKRRSIINKGIKFNSYLGAGAIFSSGEDTLFLNDCLKIGLKIIAVPEYILTLANERESTWFTGYDKKFLHDKGAVFAALSRKCAVLLCIQYLIRHSHAYKEQKISISEALKIMKSGIVDFRKFNK